MVLIIICVDKFLIIKNGIGNFFRLLYILYSVFIYLDREARKQIFADQLCSNGTTDQCLCFYYTASKICLLKSEISNFWPSSVTVQASLCKTWSETQNTSFLTSWLIFTVETGFHDVYVCLGLGLTSQYTVFSMSEPKISWVLLVL